MALPKELERQTLDLPPVDRERLARLAWQSLSGDPEAMADAALDPPGPELAERRDEAVTRGKVKAIDADEFRLRTGGA